MLTHKLPFGAAFLTLAITAAGCAGNSADQAKLNDGFTALGKNDFPSAISAAEAFTALHPTDRGAAEAKYLHGRALFSRPKADARQTAADYAQARNDFEQALALSPSSDLEALVRSDLANCAFFQEDFSKAEREWSLAFQHDVDNYTRSWTLYRVGLCQQRMSQWANADQTYDMVMEQFPDSEPAQRARTHKGQTSFYVQVATFNNAAAADKTVLALGSQGISARKAPSASTQVVLAGPTATYEQAKALRSRVAAQFPDALVIP